MTAADEGAACRGAAEVLADDFEDLFEVAAAVEVGDRDAEGAWGSSARRPSTRPVMRSSSSEPAMGSSSRTSCSTLPSQCIARPAAESLAADEAGLVVVGSEVSSAGMGDFDGDDRCTLASRNLIAMTGATRS